MSDIVIISLIGAVPATIAAVTGILNVLMIQSHGKMLEKQKDTIESLETNTNSKFTQLLKITAESEMAKGRIEGAAEEKAKREQP